MARLLGFSRFETKQRSFIIPNHPMHRLSSQANSHSNSHLAHSGENAFYSDRRAPVGDFRQVGHARKKVSPRRVQGHRPRHKPAIFLGSCPEREPTASGYWSRYPESPCVGRSGWSHYATSLRIIDSVSGTSEEINARLARQRKDISDDAMHDLLATALRSLTNIRSMSWYISQGEPVWRRDALLGYLAAAAFVSELELTTSFCGSDLLLPTMSNLHRLIIWASYCESVLLVEQVLRLVELNSGLTCLRLFGCADVDAKVWPMLRQTGHHLKEIKAKYSMELVAYLTSYSGIERLEVDYPDGGDANAFFYRVLPIHAATLTELSCSAIYECQWSFGVDIVDAILKLQTLTHLKMSINWADIADPVNAVECLLRTVPALPALANLKICAANAEGNRGARCGNPRMRHREAVLRSVAAAVQRFRGHCSSRAVVEVDPNRFEMTPMNEPGSGAGQDAVWGYRLIPMDHNHSYLFGPGYKF
ncbi:hypothetical protein C8R45DRAFT_1073337 [Mycena sanguinolenta]|nr:hypothetical protein C8R45DRAFT_1073337 [Mycena sanguinolenta]